MRSYVRITRSFNLLPYAVGVFFLCSMLACGGGGTGDQVDGDLDSDVPNSVTDFSSTSPNVDGGVVSGPVHVVLHADTLEGNAPLSVNFWVEIEGISEDRAIITWDFGGGATSSKLDPVFTFYKSGDYNVSVEVFEMGDPSNVASDDTIVRVREPAELSVLRLNVEGATELAPGDPLKLSSRVSNTGGNVSEETPLAIFLSTDEVFHKDIDSEIGRYSLASMTSGSEIESTDIEMTVPEELAEGTYFVFALVDPDNTVAESDETNNFGLANDFISVSKTANTQSDLTIADLTFTAGQVATPGDTLSYSLSLSNQGDGDAQNFRFAVYLSLDTTFDDSDIEITAVDTTTIYVLKAGITLPIYRGYLVEDSVPEGNYYMIGRADSAGTVTELNEDNNHTVSSYTVEIDHPEVTGKDLELVSLTVPTQGTYWGGAVKIDMELRNNGTDPIFNGKGTAYFTEDLSINPNVDFELETFDLPALPPGEVVLFSTVVGVSDEVPLFDFYLGVILDPNDQISELDETNNFGVSSHAITVEESATVDIKALSCEFHPTVAEAGTEVTVSFEIKNDGSSNSGAFDAWIVLSEDAQIKLNHAKNGTDLVVDSTAIADLTGGEVLTVVEKFIVPVALPHDQTSPYTLGVIINPNNKASQDNKASDNIAIAADTLEVLNAQGGCFEDEANEPNNAASTAKCLGNVVDGACTSGDGFDAETGLVYSLDASLCDSMDWYAVEVPDGYSLRVDIESDELLALDPIDSDLNVKIFDAADVLAASGSLTGNLDTATALLSETTQAYKIKVYPAINGNKASYTMTTTVIPPIEGVDLFVKHVAITPDNTFPGGVASVSVELYNLGSEDSGDFDITLHLSENSELDAEDSFIHSVEVSSIPPTTSFTVESTVILPVEVGSGEYRVLAVADSAEEVEEVYEDNNLGYSGHLVLNADLACADDGYEPNNGVEVATSVPGENTLYTELVVCPGLEDWYAVDLVPGTSFTAQITYLTQGSSAGKIYAQLIAPDGVTVVDATTSSSNPAVGIPYIFSGGTYFVRVYHSNTGTQPAPYTYNLGISLVDALPSDVCVADVYESNWGVSEAALLGCGLQQMTLCKKDRDMFAVEIPANQLVSFTLNQADSALKLEIYDDPEAPPIDDVKGNGTVSLNVESAQVFYVGVSKKTSNSILTTFDYTVFVDGISGIDLTVHPITPFPESVLQGEDSFLSFELENQCIDASTLLDFSVFLSEDGILDAGDEEIYYSSIVDGIAGKGSVNINQKVTLPQNSQVGTMSLIVAVDPYDQVAESNEWNNADFTTVEVIELCIDDAMEPNNAPTQAPVAEAGVYTDLNLCPSDYDWYTFDITAGELVDVSIEFAQEDGDLDLRLYHESSFIQPVAAGLSKDDNESLNYITMQSGTYYIRVNGFAGGANTYTMTVDY